MGPRVDLVVNVFERTYRAVLVPGWFDDVSRQNQFEFARRTVLLNNIVSPLEARHLVEPLLESGEVSDVQIVAETLSAALSVTKLSESDLKPLTHFSNCTLAAVCLEGSEYLLYWDADIRLRQPKDWITPSLQMLGKTPRVIVANPSWGREEVLAESLHTEGQFAMGYGFSDTVFLVRRDDLRHADYKVTAPASWRYPLAATTAIFEQRVDAWMRRERLLRGTFLDAEYVHVGPVGTAYPPLGTVARLRGVGQRHAGRVLAKILPKNPMFANRPTYDPPLH